MTEDEMLGIAEKKPEAPEAAPQQEEPKAEGMTRDEMLEICARYEQARMPYASAEEARQVALANIEEGGEDYLREALAWHEAGEPEIAKEAGEATDADEDEALGIK